MRLFCTSAWDHENNVAILNLHHQNIFIINKKKYKYILEIYIKIVKLFIWSKKY